MLQFLGLKQEWKGDTNGGESTQIGLAKQNNDIRGGGREVFDKCTPIWIQCN